MIFGLEFPYGHSSPCNRTAATDEQCDECTLCLANASHYRMWDHYLPMCCIPFNGLSCTDGYYPEYSDWEVVL